MFTWPWEQRDPVSGVKVAQYEDPAGPLQKSGLFFSVTDGSDFTEFGPVQTIQTSIAKVTANVSRIVSKSNNAVIPQEDVKWYDIWGKTKQAASATNEALQSTLVKVIILVVIVAMIGLFGLSYVQSKGAQLAK